MGIYILLLLTILQLVSSKRVVQQIKLSRLKDWQYFTKFGGDLGRNEYYLKFRILGLEKEQSRFTNIRFELYLDEDWPEVLETNDCDKHLKTRRQEPFEIPSDGSYSQEFNGYLQSNVRAHMWYFTFSDCDQTFRKVFTPTELRNAKLEIDFHILNTGNTEFSIEQFGLTQLQSVMTIANLVLLIYNCKLIWVKHKKYGEFNQAQFFLVITMFLETLSYIANLIHLIVYSYNGFGVTTLQVISLILQICAQFSLTMILVMMSWGWYINFTKFDNFEIYLPVSLLIAFFQATIVGIGFIDHDSYYKDHNYEGWVGWLASAIFIFEFIYFLNGVINTYRKESAKVREFITMLGIYGGLFFLSFPMLQTINLIVARYYRYRVMEVGIIAFRALATLLLSRLFTSKKSIFAQISIENQSFLDRQKED